ncbi:pre-peptidase C-terminal domain-containing protein [Shinella curvata]|uniref:pre-peptidase C-terminal domain-containing protein n=2 Tax=Shinella curvata TaxID=1817964 RepID=UPI001FD4BFF4|nr:pre-peptidase C-terminal domain-containing protein [Shinella curvata]MCJ8052497.1 pre-peptidase C-terminal domain-containing protein [Shinella curvata]
MSTIPGNPSTTATISKGQAINGSLTFAGDSDWYKASFSAGLDYGFRLSGDGSSLTDPDLTLHDANGTVLAGGTNYSSNTVTVNFSATLGGTYFVGVKDSSDIGNYNLVWLGNDTIRRDANTTATLSQGQTVKSAVDVVGDSDWFKISLKAGLDYGFSVSGDGSNTSLPDADLILRDANGTQLAGGTNYSNSTYAISHAAKQTGTYFIDIRDSGEAGNYSLRWLGNDTILRNTSTTVALGTGASITSAIDVQGDSDWFKVSLKAGISYAFTVTGTGTSGLPDGDIYLRDANGNKIAGSTNYSYATGLVTFTAQSAGTYFVEVTDASDIGRYIVSNPSLDTVFNNVNTDRSLLVGRSTTGKIDVEADSDWYGFTVKSGVTYRFTSSGTGDVAGVDGVRLALRDANGNLIKSDSNSVAVVEFTATSSGKIFLDIAGYNSSVKGKFVLSAVSDAPVLKGTSASETLTGGDTATKIYGYAGNDTLYGADGNDILIGGTGADRLYGGSGSDTASYAGAKASITASLTKPSINTGDAKGDRYSSIENLTGSSHADKLTGNTKANSLDGGAGNDILKGLAGNDKLYGGSGNDKLYGGTGADKLYGGAGADLFVFTSTKDSTTSSRDMIYDFSQKQGDRIHLSGIDARDATSKNDAFTFIGEKAFSEKAGELRYFHKSGDTFVYGDVDGDGKADFALRLDKTIDLVKGDFIL